MQRTQLRPFFILLLPGLVCLFLLTQAAAKIPDDPKITYQRQQFLAAEKALQNNQLDDYQKIKQNLLDYPLLPYLQYQEIKQKLSQQTSTSIRSVLNDLDGTPLSGQLRRDWLKHLSKQKRWKTYLAFSRPGGSITSQCTRLQAMINTGQQQQAFNQVKPIWLSGHSQPKACDPVFKAWIAKGHLSKALVWQRIDLAMNRGQIRLARYLKKFLDKDDQPTLDHWIQLYRHPEKIVELKSDAHPMHDEMIVFAIRRLARKDVAQALNTWERFQVEHTFSDSQHLKVARRLASYLVRKPDQKLTAKLVKLTPPHLRLDSKLSDKHFQAALQQNDWNRVLITIDALPAQEKAQERWRYWRARALIELGQREKGHELLKGLATVRSYYGFLAADRIGDQFNFAHQSLSISEDLVKQMASEPGLIRARELKTLDRMLDARREWHLALKNRSTDELKGAARLAQEWDWPSQAIMTLAKLKYWHDLELRFPLQHRDAVDQHANNHGIDSAWIYAILRQESAFMQDARSGAGAMGLMQLMPRTARQVASKTKHGPLGSKDLFQPQVNIKLGTSYLNEVYRELQESPVLATAAYNAGPHRVKQWLPQKNQPSDVWIETVPFHETREYLKRVLAYTLIYTHRLGDSPTRLPESWNKPIESSKNIDTNSGV